MAGIRSKLLQSGDIFWVRDNGVLSYYSRLVQAGLKNASEEDLVPTHCGFFYKDDAYDRPPENARFYNLELANMQKHGACVEKNDPFIRIGKKDNCPGIMGVSRPFVFGSAGTMTTDTAWSAQRRDWFFRKILIDDMKCVGKTEYDFGWVASTVLGRLGVLTLNPFLAAYGVLRRRILDDNRHICSTWILSVMMMCAAWRYAEGDGWITSNGLLMPGLRPYGYPNYALTQTGLEAMCMNKYKGSEVVTPWILKNRLLGDYTKGTYGRGLLAGALRA